MSPMSRKPCLDPYVFLKLPPHFSISWFGETPRELCGLCVDKCGPPSPTAPCPLCPAQAGFITASPPDWPFSKALPSSCLPGCHMLLSIPSQAAPLAGSLCTYGLHSLRTYSPNSSLLPSAHHLLPFCGCKFHYHTSDAKGLSPAYAPHSSTLMIASLTSSPVCLIGLSNSTGPKLHP